MEDLIYRGSTAVTFYGGDADAPRDLSRDVDRPAERRPEIFLGAKGWERNARDKIVRRSVAFI